MIRRLIASTAFASLALTLAACAADKAPAPVADAQGIVAKTDWSKSRRVDVGLSAFEFTPANLTLQQNQPYVLHLANTDDDTHTFSSATLFSAVAVQKLVRGGVETPGLATNGVSLAPKEQADLYIVPVKTGSYRIYCDEFMHDTMGMHGDVTIQ